MFDSLVTYKEFDSLAEVKAVRSNELFPLIIESVNADPFSLMSEHINSFTEDEQMQVHIQLAGYMQEALDIHDLFIEGKEVSAEQVESIRSRLKTAENEMNDETLSIPKRVLILFGIIAFWGLIAPLVWVIFASTTGSALVAAIIALIVYYGGVLITAQTIGREIEKQDRKAMAKARDRAVDVRKALEKIDKDSDKNNASVKQMINRLEDLERQSNNHKEFIADR